MTTARVVLADLHRTRRRTRIQEIDAFEALYRVYVIAIVGGIAVWILSGLTGDYRVGPSTVITVRQHGAQVVGAAIGLAWAVGLRSGGRGGPLVIEAPEVRHVLLSPIPRSVVLRPLALRQLRFGTFVGALVGAVGGLLAFRRLPGPALSWVASGAAVGALTVAGALGLGLTVSGNRPQGAVGRWTGGLLGLAVLGWSGADLATRSATSPATWLGRFAISPLGWQSGSLIGVTVAVAAVGAGISGVGGCSIEAAERRATLVGQMRFAATLRDIRTVVVLRRQLSQELPRQRRKGQAGSVARRRPARWPGWRRGWQGIVRFPPLRVVRLIVLGAAAGAAAAGAWRGTTPLIFAAGVALYVAALDVVEPLAQELDHPDRRDGYPSEAGALYLRLLGPSLVVMLGVAGVGVATAGAIGAGRVVAWQVGLALALPAAAAAVAAAVTSVIQGPPAAVSATNLLLPPEVAGIRALVRTGWPPILATLGVVPLLAGRHVRAGQSAVGGVIDADVPVMILVVIVGIWVRKHEAIHASFRRIFSDLDAGVGGRAGAGGTRP